MVSGKEDQKSNERNPEVHMPTLRGGEALPISRHTLMN
jgi:hypothetical protein